MNRTDTLIHAISRVHSELKDLIGGDYPDFELQLSSYLVQLKNEPHNVAIVRSYILDLFSQFPAAYQRLMDEMDEIKNASQRRNKGEDESEVLGPVSIEMDAGLVRYTDISCPSRISVGTSRFSVVVRLTVSPSQYSAAIQEISVKPALPVRVRIDAPNFEILSQVEQEITIPEDRDSLPIVFDLHPTNIGLSRINVDFFQGGNPLGTVSFAVEIVSMEIITEIQDATEKKLRLKSTESVPADMMLFITYEQLQDHPAFIFTLFRAGEVGRTFAPVLLQGDPIAYIQRLYKQLTILSNQLEPTSKLILGQERIIPKDDAERRIKQLGQNLWRDLIPSDLKALYTAERVDWAGKTLLIVSDEPHIPWELIWPYMPNQWEDELPWSVQMRLTRWLRRDAQGNGHEAPPSQLAIKRLACIAPTDSNLPAAQKEEAFLKGLIVANGLSDISPDLPIWSKLVCLLEDGGYDWLHVAAHGNFYPESADSDSAIWLQDKRAFVPDTVVGASIEGYISQHRPSFVFNACHSGRQAWVLTRLGGWANRFISSGAGLFLAPLWTVTDDKALDFAKAFYRELLTGSTVAEAVHMGRLSARGVGDPTWLSYSVYAHPNAKIVY